MMGPMSSMSSMSSSMSSTPPPPHHGAFFAAPGLRTFLPAARLRTFIAILLFLQLISFFIIHAIFADAPTHHRLNSAYRDELATELTHARLASSRASSRLQDALQAIHILHRALRDDGLRMIRAKELAERVHAVIDTIEHAEESSKSSHAASSSTTSSTRAPFERYSRKQVPPPPPPPPPSHPASNSINHLPTAPSLAPGFPPTHAGLPPLYCSDDDLENVAAGLSITPDPQTAIAAVVVVTHNRPDYLTKTLHSVQAAYDKDSNNLHDFPLYVSQDGHDQATRRVVVDAPEFKGRWGHLEHDQSEPVVYEKSARFEAESYYRISAHYRWFLHQLFECRGYSKVIILEDDMLVAADFFSYFRAASKLMDRDESLWCASSWNDNGKVPFAKVNDAVYRSEFFPGLGWMMKRETFLELAPEWPRAYWDDWMRLAKTRKGRECIRPEICRTYNIGEKGASKGQFFKTFLKDIRISAEPVDWERRLEDGQLDFLQPRQAYETYFSNLISAAKPVSTVAQAQRTLGDVLLTYRSESDFVRIARSIGIFDEWKDGIPRTSWRGVVVFWLNDATRVFLAPSIDYI
ncbi:alpha-1,3-mannosyl-glycoprotein beta-1,2-N-acetylglucosaminyltransferase [Pycnococcus provasolii]